MIRAIIDRWLLMPTLWHSLHNALPRHPLLWYRQSGGQIAPVVTRPWQRWLIYGFIVLVACNTFVVWSLANFSLEVLLPIVGLVVGIHTTVNISTSLARERENGRYYLTALTPSGQLGASWAVVARFLKRNAFSLRMQYYIDAMHVIWLIIALLLLIFSLFVVVGVVSFNQQRLLPEGVALVRSLNLLSLLILARADYQYSLVSAALIGMIAPTFGRNRLESYLIALAGFLGVQAAVFILWLLIGGGVSGLLWNAVGPEAAILNTVALLAVYVIIREASLHAICILMALRLHTSRREILGISRLSI